MLLEDTYVGGRLGTLGPQKINMFKHLTLSSLGDSGFARKIIDPKITLGLFIGCECPFTDADILGLMSLFHIMIVFWWYICPKKTFNYIQHHLFQTIIFCLASPIHLATSPPGFPDTFQRHQRSGSWSFRHRHAIRRESCDLRQAWLRWVGVDDVFIGFPFSWSGSKWTHRNWLQYISQYNK